MKGAKLDGPASPEAWTTLTTPPPWSVGDGAVIPANEYFVMGDNRNRSQDSRIFGPIGRDRIDGRAWFRIWPIDHFGNIYAQMPMLQSGSASVGHALTPDPNAPSVANRPIPATRICPPHTSFATRPTPPA